MTCGQPAGGWPRRLLLQAILHGDWGQVLWLLQRGDWGQVPAAAAPKPQMRLWGFLPARVAQETWGVVPLGFPALIIAAGITERSFVALSGIIASCAYDLLAFDVVAVARAFA